MGAAEIDYSVVIRTLGTAGGKYRALLDSIKAQTIQPREVLVVMPEDTDGPEERLGTERIVRTRRGPVHQRCFGMRMAKGDFLLICDDDIRFESDFVEKLYRTHVRTRAEIVTPNVSDSGDRRPPSLRSRVARLRDFLCGLSYVSSKPSPFFIRVWDTGGYIKNGRLEPDRQYYAQSGHGTCAFLKRESADRLRFQDEMWLEDARYALPDDQVMFYKAFLQGNAIAWCRSAGLEHLDAGRDSPDRFVQMSYANSRNFSVFWHRFLFKPNAEAARRLRLIVCLAFRIINNCLLYGAVYLPNPRRSAAALALYRGYLDAFKFIRSERYRQLPVLLHRTRPSRD